jgi:DNA sulfur modification protein DndD
LIKKLSLKNFGKFREASFDFKEITLFYGENESGKTTLFDAIMLKTTDIKSKSKSKEGRELKRYDGSIEPEISLETDGQETIPYEIFFNIFAIRAGEISLDFNDDKFSEEITKKILESEVSLKEFMEKVKKKADTNDGKLVLNKEKIELKKELEENRNEKQEAEKKLNEIKKLEIELREKENELQRMNEEKEEKERRLKELETARERLDKAKELKRLSDDYNNIVELENKKEELGRYPEIDETKLSSFLEKNKELTSLKEEIKKLNDFKKNYSTERDKKKEKISGIGLELDPSKIERLKLNLKNIERFEVINWILMIISVLIALAFLFFLNQLKLFSIITFILGLFLSLFVFFSIRFFVKSQKSEIELILFKEPQKKSSIKDLKQQFYKFIEEFNFSKRMIEETSKEIEEKENKIKECDLQIEEKNSRIQKLEKEIKDYLLENKANSFEEILERRGKIKELRNYIAALEERIKKSMQGYQDAGNEREFEAYLRRKIKDLEDEGISIREYDEVRFRKISSENGKLKVEIEEISKRISETEKEIAEKKGKLSGLNESIEKYKSLEKEIEEKEKRLDEIKKQQLAYGKILSILEEIEIDATYKFNQIANEISNEFSEFFPHFKNVKINSLEKLDLELKDISGVQRKFGFLSTGTKDIFLLAFRILLAKMVNRGNFLIFDEPFLSLDEKRIDTMLNILKKFHDNYKWQLIFFTKDRTLKELVENKFKDKAKIHNLS